MRYQNVESKSLSWDEVENKIEEEVRWLHNSLSLFHNNPHQELKDLSVQYGHCNECILRKIAMLIISGQVKAREFFKSELLSSFWSQRFSDDRGHDNTSPVIYHGKRWHSEKMEIIEDHFLSQGCDVVLEPNIHWGRADLGIHKKGEKDLIVEVGTTSVLKLFINLKKMKNTIFLIVPDDEKLIEFTT